jgi:hypothetical protein
VTVEPVSGCCLVRVVQRLKDPGEREDAEREEAEDQSDKDEPLAAVLKQSRSPDMDQKWAA